MNANRQTAVIQANNKEQTMKISASNLIPWAGLAAMAAGIIFAGIQPIHIGHRPGRLNSLPHWRQAS